MRPTDYPLNTGRLTLYWEKFFNRQGSDPQDLSSLDPVILSSWKRCAPLFDPLGQPRASAIRLSLLETLLKAQTDLISISIPHLEDIFQYTIGSDTAILLTDGSGCLLAVTGDDTAVEALNQLGLRIGTYWSESQVGTNALGLVLVNAMPIQVVGPEHYFQRYHHLATSAAPVYGVNGRIIGVIGLVGRAEVGTSHDLALVMGTARAVSNQLQTNFYLEEANDQIRQVRTLLETINDGVLAWDNDGKITQLNAQAADMLELKATAVRGMPLHDVLTFPPLLAEAVAEQKELIDVETKLNIGSKFLNCWISLRPILHSWGEVQGFIATLRPAQAVRRLINQQIATPTSFRLDEIESQSTAMRGALRQAHLAARGNAPVLLIGEGGVGKNPFARAIHNGSPRASQPFISINCGAIPHELIIEELLGYEKSQNGERRPSKFELVDGGTLLLNQIDSLSREMQMALLEIFETRHVMRLGGAYPIPVNVRIIATTSADLERLVADHRFLPELFYRFSIFKITIPALRERPSDIPYLVERFLARVSERSQQPLWIDDQALAILQRYPWPGNIRELEDVLERAAVQSPDGVIRLLNLPDNVRQGRVFSAGSPVTQPVLTAAEAEREAILRAGWACDGNVSRMAQELQIGRTTLWRKMKRLNLAPEHFKAS